MCGIVGYLGPRDPKDVILKALRRLEYRGYDSAGIAVLEGDRFEVQRCEGRIEGLEKRLANKTFKGRIAIGHTRWATHGAPNEINAHPHQVGRVVLVHNGIIENYDEHKDRLIRAGRKMSSDTDSEIVAHLIDEKMATGLNLEAAVRSVLPDLRGTYAFVLMAVDEPDCLVAVRRGSPLLIGLGEGEQFFASDVQAILEYTRRVVYLDDGQLAVLKRAGVSVYDQKGKEITPSIKTIQWNPENLDRVGYPTYMLKEIFEQPRALTNTIEGNIDHREGIVELTCLLEHAEVIKKASRVCLIACGTSKHAGLVGKYYLEQFARIPAEVDFASEFRYRNPVLDEQTLCIFISQSGETLDTLAALREARSRGIPSLALCNVRDSTLAREADMVLYTNAGPEIGVASTKAFTTQLVSLYLLAIQIGRLKASLFPEQYRQLTHDLVRLPILTERALETAASLEAAAKVYQV